MARQFSRAEGQMGQDGQFLGRIAAIDVHGRVGLGIAALLGFGQGRGIVGIVFLHLREDEIARAVKDSVDRLDLVGDQALAEGRDDGDASGHGGLEGDRAALLSRPIEQLRPMFGQEGLVGRDHVLAAVEQLQDDGPCGLQPPDQFHRRHNIPVADHLVQVGREHARRQGKIPWPLQVRVDHVDQFQPLPPCRAMRSPCSNNNRATPEPIVP